MHVAARASGRLRARAVASRSGHVTTTGSLPVVIEVDEETFEDLVGDALDGIPEDLARLMTNVAVMVEDGHAGSGLLGLYRGVPLTARDAGYDGWFTVEAFGQALPALAAATRIWRPLFDSEDEVVSAGARVIRMICIVSAPEGVALVDAHHPDVVIYTPVIDKHLNDHKYIVPGLGDFGDRLYGTS